MEDLASEPSRLFAIAAGFVVLLSGLAVLGFHGLRALSRKLGSLEPAPPFVWNWALPVVVIGILFLGYAVVDFAFSDDDSTWIRFVVLNNAGLILASSFLMGYVGWHGRIEALGFAATPASYPGLAVLAYFCFLPGYLLLIAGWNALLSQLPDRPPPQAALLALTDQEGWELVFAVATIALSAPFFEELFFRGLLLPTLESRFGERWGLLLTSACFAAVHETIALLPTFALGLFFGYLYQRSRRIWVPFVAHALHNGLMVSLWIGFPRLREWMGE